MPLSPRRSDDADVIRARLRALLDDGRRTGGWIPADEDLDEIDGMDGNDEHDARPDRGLAPSSVPDASAGLPPGIGRHRSPGRAMRWDPGPLGARSVWVVGLLAALILIGWTWLDRPRVQPVPVDPNALTSSAGTPAGVPAAPSVGEVAVTSSTVVVSVVGQVVRPGLVTLPPGSRVADAIEAAGGTLPGVDTTSINLAAVVSDGEQVAVGVPAPATAAGAAPGPGSTDGPVNLNTATAGELDALPGIGPVLAERIVAHRTAQGPFTDVGQLDDVAGIGPATAAELADLVGV